MAILCVGSINVDHVYRVPHIVTPGETLAATGYARGLGGKGANQSIAAAKAGARVVHLGRVGADGSFAVEEIAAAGADVTHVASGPEPTGHAIITVDPSGENAIVLFAGANAAMDEARIATALKGFGSGDTLLLQNEVNVTEAAARSGRAAELRVVYSAAPFDAEHARKMLPLIDVLILNEGEAQALEKALNRGVSTLSGIEIIITRGADGAEWRYPGGQVSQPAFPVDAVIDTTGAGDCFAGYLVAGLDQGQTREEAMRYASAAAALQVTRAGAAAAMPTASEVQAFLKAQGR